MLPNCLKRRKNVVWQSADDRVTSNHCRVTVEQLFTNIFLIAWKVGRTLFESQRTVAWLSGYFASVFVSNGFTYASVCFFLVLFLLSDDRVSIRYILITWLLLEEKANPGFYDIKCKIFLGRREFSILVGKFPLADFPGGKQIPLF